MIDSSAWAAAHRFRSRDRSTPAVDGDPSGLAHRVEMPRRNLPVRADRESRRDPEPPR